MCLSSDLQGVFSCPDAKQSDDGWMEQQQQGLVGHKKWEPSSDDLGGQTVDLGPGPNPEADADELIQISFLQSIQFFRLSFWINESRITSSGITHW